MVKHTTLMCVPPEFVASFLNPDPNLPKYQGRNPLEGLIESARRKKVFEIVSGKSIEIAQSLNIEPPDLLMVGSCALGLATSKSDLDIAIITDGDTFVTDSLWNGENFARYNKEMVDMLNAIDAPFQVNPQLVSPSISRRRIKE